MGNLTIDQILAEARGESPDVYVLGKQASAQPPKSSSFTDEEVEKMAGLLKNAEFPQSAPETFNEKVAAALILSDALNSLVKEAQDNVLPPAKDWAPSKDEEVKLAQFIDKASAAGYSEKEINSFLEKKAGIKDVAGRVGKFLSRGMKSKAGKGLAVAAGIGGAGAAGHYTGEKAEHEKAKKVMPLIFQAGAKRGYDAGTQKGFQAGAYASDTAWRKFINSKMQQQG